MGRWPHSTHPISIHAPRVGSDAVPAHLAVIGGISIHAPRVGSDEAAVDGGPYRSIFQSTLPVWGATRQSSCGLSSVAYFNPRSPCGERLSAAADLLLHIQFQSTLPVWGATWAVYCSGLISLFQSTLPVWGATPAPPASPCPPHDFNPRSPCGERLQKSNVSVGPTYFNPRSPCGERHGLEHHAALGGEFQSTLPVWGATPRVWR